MSLHGTGYAVSSYLPHNTLLLLPHSAAANESELLEWELSSPHSVALHSLQPHHQLDPDLRRRASNLHPSIPDRDSLISTQPTLLVCCADGCCSG